MTKTVLPCFALLRPKRVLSEPWTNEQRSSEGGSEEQTKGVSNKKGLRNVIRDWQNNEKSVIIKRMDKNTDRQSVKPERLTAEQIEAAQARRFEAMHLQKIEGNPLDAEDIAMFEMFERKRWSHERCRAYILEQASKLAASQAAE